MPRETMAAKRERALEVARRMNEHYPAAECALVYGGLTKWTAAISSPRFPII